VHSYSPWVGLIHTVTRRPLSEFVDFLWLSQGYAQPHAAERVLPTGCMNLIFDLDEHGQAGNTVSGACTRSFVLNTSRPLSLVGVQRLHRGAGRHPAVRFALDAFQNPTSVSSVASVVARTGLTSRRFIASFRDEVGLTPKVFCRLSRFRHVIGTLESAPAIDWPAIALACGYFDQAHFIHDFRAFAGVSPTAYLRHRTTSVNHVRVAD
jgi:transcriptional regulator GlxA family with amidase domain